MTVRTVEVEAGTVLEARSLAVAKSREDLFDPIRVTDSRVVGFVGFSAGGAVFQYRVHIEGHPLTEGEARELYGGR